MTSQSKRILVASVLACLSPMVLGIALFQRLPDPMPIHFAFNGTPDGWAPKWFAVFGLPVLMAAIDAATIAFTERAIPKGEQRPRIAAIMNWIIPAITIVLYVLTIRAGLGNTSYIGKLVCLLLGVMFLLTGNYMPKMSFQTARQMRGNHRFSYPHLDNESTYHLQARRAGIALMLAGVAFLVLALFV